MPDLLEFVPRLETLPPPQRRLWGELGQTPAEFVLYGGTALALRLGHRTSEDFDFFSAEPFDPVRLQASVPYLRGAEVLRQAADTLTCLLDRNGLVRVSYFGGLRLDWVNDPQIAKGAGVKVASLIDLAAAKAELVQRRASVKDYIDLDAAIAQGGVSLEEALAAAGAVHGPAFNPLPTLKALVYFGDGDLATVPEDVRRRLAAAVKGATPRRPRRLQAASPRTGLVPQGCDR